ncbi:MAG: NifB/NifX family molybdenum-iron cluster-binding protein [Candidatus Asgardarchaeia archaeon]
MKSELCKNSKILLPTHEPGGLDVKIYPHWASAPTYTFVKIDNGVPSEISIHKLKSDDLLIKLIKKLGVKFVIAASLSIRALTLLEKIEVKVATSAPIIVKDAIDKFCKGNLRFVKVCYYKI